ncbi:uncharacterized protein N7498_005139 [Penicillium cinerascens]|uniref:SGNH hydrolase-type esterase domain-containing protein n=1 Tax=Penicillium cinerascens TaxID=70096 RepID=A0A9W9T097_9EURO|nr:uncharacterized protein N7498_005139 [Penicillium cinerascens]KAJ5204260.1 hypothetical protein N7498_005139 [Penicillium cinerascens]
MGRSPIHRAVLAALWLTLLSLAAAIALPKPDSQSEVPFENEVSTLQARADKFLLRIMPLGASITMGYKSTDGNGYREHIRQQLRYEGWQVDMVGSKRNGTMHNNHHEGHIGFRVDQLMDVVDQTIPKQPNLILINAGTNDATQKHSISSVGTRMNSLISKLIDQIEGTTIILSTLLPNGLEPELVKEINKQYRTLAAFWRAKNGRVVLAEMSNLIKEDQLVDGTHPDDYGYKEMASVWWAAIQVAQAEGMLQQASDTSVNGTISDAFEKSLDDSTDNPDLPAYAATPQPVLNGGVSNVGLGMGWILGLQVLGSALMMGCL